MPAVSEQVGTSEFQQFRQSVESLLLGAMVSFGELFGGVFVILFGCAFGFK